MLILFIQIFVLCFLLVALILWWHSFPYPSPLVRRFLPARYRWPEVQIREWLNIGRFHQSYLKYFYRDPARLPPAGNGILAPADGIVTSAHIQNGTRYLVIALSFWDMHIQYSPLSGEVLEVQDIGDTFTDGEGRNFVFLREKSCPVQKRIVIRTPVGELAVRLITSLAARRIQVFVEEGAIVNRGEKIGRILLGSTVVLELPSDYPINVMLQQRVWAGETIVADLTLHSKK